VEHLFTVPSPKTTVFKQVPPAVAAYLNLRKEGKENIGGEKLEVASKIY
jgi:hypothetical protein